MIVGVLLFGLLAVYVLLLVRVVDAAFRLRDLVSMQRHREAVFYVRHVLPQVRS